MGKFPLAERGSLRGRRLPLLMTALLLVGSVPVQAKEAQSIPSLALGQEIAGDVANGDRKLYGKDKPVSLYRFAARKGQRICVRVASPNRNVHAYLIDRPKRKSPPVAGTWIAFAPKSDRKDRSLLTEIKEDGETYLVVMAHAVENGAPVYTRPLAEGQYELKIWDADQPEPASELPLLAKDQHPASTTESYYGSLHDVMGTPLITERAIFHTFEIDQRGRLVQNIKDQNGRAVGATIWAPTGRRGEYNADGGFTFQVQCDGTLIRHEPHNFASYWVNQDGELRMYGLGYWPSNMALWSSRLEPHLHDTFRHVSKENLEKVLATAPARRARDAADQRAIAEVFERSRREQEAAAAEEARKKAARGNLLGTLVGASVGAYAGAAAGLDTSQVAGAMMKGASVTSSGPLAGALGSTGDQLLSGGSATSAMGAAAGTGGARASYPTKPNLALGACSGFSEANYRTKALEGGGDSQLNTMCGQAFEYYTMYKRAIAQGYSEADANRTYAAHEQAARVASGYLASHGAN